MKLGIIAQKSVSEVFTNSLTIPQSPNPPIPQSPNLKSQPVPHVPEKCYIRRDLLQKSLSILEIICVDLR